jgi:adenylylsulfate kinase-like enzyme
LYAKARKGELKNFTGIDSLYEVPEFADIQLSTENETINTNLNTMLSFLTDGKWI